MSHFNRLFVQFISDVAAQQGMSEPCPLHQMGGRPTVERPTDTEQGQRAHTHPCSQRWRRG